ncbi:hypothetical protein CHUAL_013974 [Chamberlinius hualienensis]
MFKILIITLSIFIVTRVICVGSRNSLKMEDKHSSSLRKAASFATNEIHYKKLKQGEYDKCTRLENEIISGEKQVVSGLIYSLQLKIKPVAVESEQCQGKKVQVDWKPELCETEIQWQAWKEPQMELRRAVCLKIED